MPLTAFQKNRPQCRLRREKLLPLAIQRPWSRRWNHRADLSYHGNEATAKKAVTGGHMCCKERSRECCCEKPDRVKGRPEICTPEQIQECHGEAREHPCATQGKRT